VKVGVGASVGTAVTVGVEWAVGIGTAVTVGVEWAVGIGTVGTDVGTRVAVAIIIGVGTTAVSGSLVGVTVAAMLVAVFSTEAVGVARIGVTVDATGEVGRPRISVAVGPTCRVGSGGGGSGVLSGDEVHVIPKTASRQTTKIVRIGAPIARTPIA